MNNVQNKVKPFFIGVEANGLDEGAANKILLQCKAKGAIFHEGYKENEAHVHADNEYSVEGYPYFGVDKHNRTVVIDESRYEAEYTEISPEDIPTWLSHGLTQEGYWRSSMLALSDMQGNGEDAGAPLSHNRIPSNIESVSEKPTLGLQPRKIWLQLRQYEIIDSLYRQRMANELLNEDWVEELVALIGECNE